MMVQDKNSKMKEQKVIDINGIPQCPYFMKPTKRNGGGGSITCMYYPHVYDEHGVNTNHDRNIRTSGCKFLACGKQYITVGNIDGFYYE